MFSNESLVWDKIVSKIDQIYVKFLSDLKLSKTVLIFFGPGYELNFINGKFTSW